MKINAAKEADFDTVRSITQQTIKAVYPHYYPKGAVDFFLAHHRKKKIMGVIRGAMFFCSIPTTMKRQALLPPRKMR